MIGITFISQVLQEFCSSNLLVEKFKIYIRLNFSIDLYAVTKNNYTPNDFKQRFQEYLVDNYPENVIDLNDVKVKISLCDATELSGDSLFEDMFNNKNNDIEQGPRLRFNSLLNKKTNLKFERHTPIVTFYSYKGGWDVQQL